jgi:AcrR family transcriptional regulator
VLSSNLPKKLVGRAEKRDHILNAARQVFAERGVVEVTMEDIAKAAGVAKGSLYLHFASKDELYLHLSAQGGRALLERIEEAVRRPTGFQAMHSAAQEYARFSIEDPMRFRLDVAWLAPGYRVDYQFPMAQEYRDVITKVMRICVEAFVTGQRDGSIRPELDAAMTVYQIWGAILGLVILRAKAAFEGPVPPQADPAAWSHSIEGNNKPIDVDRFVPDYIDQLLSLIERKT